MVGTAAWTPSGSWNWWPWGDFWDSPPISAANPAMGIPVKTYICPSEPRNITIEYLAQGSGGTNVTAIAYTEYLGVDGLQGQDDGAFQQPPQSWKPGDKSGILVDSDIRARKITIASISDGSSNTLMVGERPPSSDLSSGWWFAGAGFDGSGVGDVTLGAREVVYAANIPINLSAGGPSFGCPLTKVGFQPGSINDPCDQLHF